MIKQLPKFIVKDKEQVYKEKLYKIERKLAGLPQSKHRLLSDLDVIQYALSMIE